MFHSINVYKKEFIKNHILKIMTFRYTNFPNDYKKINEMSLSELVEYEFTYSSQCVNWIFILLE